MAAETNDTEFNEYVETLHRPSRDLEGNLIPAGTDVLQDPEIPDAFLADTPANRRRFRRRGFAWSRRSSRGHGFGDSAEAVGLASKVDTIREVEHQFHSAIASNLSDVAGTELSVAPTGWVDALWPWPGRFPKAIVAGDFDAALVEATKTHWGVPSGIELPGTWQEVRSDVNKGIVRVIRRPGTEIHIVTAFVTAFRSRRNRRPRIVPLTPEIVDSVRSAHASWSAARSDREPTFVYFVIGTAGPLDDELMPRATNRCCELFGSHSGSAWEFRRPRDVTGGIHRVQDQLVPITRQARIASLRDAIDARLHGGFVGAIRLEALRRDTPFSAALMQESFRMLESSGEYRVFLTEGGDLAIAKSDWYPSGCTPVRYRIRPAVWPALLVGIAALLLGTATMIVQFAISESPPWLGVLEGFVFLYGAALAMRFVSVARELAPRHSWRTI